MTLLCLAALWLAGFSLVRFLFPRAPGWSLHNVWLFSLGIGMGAGVASCLYFLVLAIAGPSTSVLAGASIAVLAVSLALGFFAPQPSVALDWADGPRVPKSVLIIAALAAVLAVAMFIGAITYSPHGDEAAWSVWNLRARFLFRSGAMWHIAFAKELVWSHLDYPLLIPSLVAWCWKLGGGESTAAPSAIAFLFALGTAGLMTTTVGALRGKMSGLIAGALLLATPSFPVLAAAQYGDVPLAFYILAVVGLLCLEDRFPENGRFALLAGLMAGFAAWTRNEGCLFLLAVIVARLVTAIRFGNWSAAGPRLVRFLAGALAPAALVLYFKLRIGEMGNLFSTPAAILWKNAIDPARWILTIQGLVVTLFTFGRFLLPAVLALALYAYLVRFRVDHRDRASLSTVRLALWLTLAADLVADILSDASLTAELSTSLERLLLQLWPAALLAFFAAVAPLELLAVVDPKKAKKDAKMARAAK